MPLTLHSEPQVSSELQTLIYLDSRMTLSKLDKRNLYNLQKGYEGERVFFHLLNKKLSNDCIRLFSLLLNSNDSEFQIDNALIFQNTIFINEVKNFEGEFIIKDEKWYAIDTSKELETLWHNCNEAVFYSDISFNKWV